MVVNKSLIFNWHFFSLVFQEEEPHRAMDESPSNHTSASAEVKREHHPVKVTLAISFWSETLKLARLFTFKSMLILFWFEILELDCFYL